MARKVSYLIVLSLTSPSCLHPPSISLSLSIVIFLIRSHFSAVHNITFDCFSLKLLLTLVISPWSPFIYAPLLLAMILFIFLSNIPSLTFFLFNSFLFLTLKKIHEEVKIWTVVLLLMIARTFYI